MSMCSQQNTSNQQTSHWNARHRHRRFKWCAEVLVKCLETPGKRKIGALSFYHLISIWGKASPHTNELSSSQHFSCATRTALSQKSARLRRTSNPRSCYLAHVEASFGVVCQQGMYESHSKKSQLGRKNKDVSVTCLTVCYGYCSCVANGGGNGFRLRQMSKTCWRGLLASEQSLIRSSTRLCSRSVVA